jgi:hypothetical protein
LLKIRLKAKQGDGPALKSQQMRET